MPLVRIGKYEFRDPDYRQILIWGNALELEPVEVTRRLQSSSFWEDKYWGPTRFSVKNGSIVTLAWNFDLLPLSVFEWVDGLKIRELGFKGTPAAPPNIALQLASLARLNCARIGLVDLDLSKIPAQQFLVADSVKDV